VNPFCSCLRELWSQYSTNQASCWTELLCSIIFGIFLIFELLYINNASPPSKAKRVLLSLQFHGLPVPLFPQPSSYELWDMRGLPTNNRGIWPRRGTDCSYLIHSSIIMRRKYVLCTYTRSRAISICLYISTFPDISNCTYNTYSVYVVAFGISYRVIIIIREINK
jgi:hypothetical protein